MDYLEDDQKIKQGFFFFHLFFLRVFKLRLFLLKSIKIQTPILPRAKLSFRSVQCPVPYKLSIYFLTVRAIPLLFPFYPF